ncbi:MAG: histidine phosphatase family protein [Planctomycetes bacterium]|nr:histidine phosphatase family protein [Planctomycetota bacterium]
MARLLLLARHGSIGAACAGRYIGATDASLDVAGRRQASALAEVLKALGPQRCFSSPLRRAAETAELAAAPLGLKVQLDPDLREVGFGLWEGKTFEEIQQAEPEAVNRWAADPAGFAFPGGERVCDFLARVHRAADRLAAAPGDVVLAVTHGGVVRAAICHLLGLPAHNYLLFGVKPASLTSIELFDGKGVLTGINNQCCEEE